MASTKQIEANRNNATHSTGPKTEDGKAASRGNALTHGLSGNGVVLTHDVEAEVEARLEQWRDELPSDTPRQRWLAEQTVVESVRIERCQRQFFRLCRDHAERAGHSWEEDRRCEAQVVFGRLKAAPELTSRELLATPHGCERLIEAWRNLGQAIDDQGDWTEDQRQDALDLLGHPRGYRQGRTLVDPAGVPDLAVYRRDYVLKQLDALKARIESGLARSDRHARSLASSRALGAELTTPVRTTLRLETACHRRYRSAVKELDALKMAPFASETTAAPEQAVEDLLIALIEQDTSVPEPEPEPKPAPEPEPELESVIDMLTRPLTVSTTPTEAETLVHSPFTEALAHRLETTSPAHSHPQGNRHERRAAEALKRHS